MDNAVNLGTFLVERRTQLQRQLAGFPTSQNSAQIGLRTDEMALAIGISEASYVGLENGQASLWSTKVLNDVATALQLHDDEVSVLQSSVQKPARPIVRANECETNHWAAQPNWVPIHDERSAALILDRSFNIVGCNSLGALLFEPMFSSTIADSNGETNFARYLFLDEAAREFHVDWPAEAAALVASLRIAAGNQPFGTSIRKLIGQLSCFSGEFRARWSGLARVPPSSGLIRFNHPRLGPAEFKRRTIHLSSDDPNEQQWGTMYSYSLQPSFTESQEFDCRDFRTGWNPARQG